MRAFFAVDLPESLAEPLAAVQTDLDDAAGVRVTDPTQAHVTLQFLGEVDAGDGDGRSDGDGDGDERTDIPAADDVIAAGERAVDRAGVAPFDCSIAGLGVFPAIDYISVVWAGVEEGSEELTALHEALEAETTALGVDADDHAFTPHVTLARMDDARGKDVVQRLVRERDPEFGRFEATEIRLVESALTSDGSEYETVASFEL